MRVGLALLALLVATSVQAQQRVLFLDRCSETCLYTPGFNDSRANHSSIVNQASVLASFAHGDPSWNTVVACVRDSFAPFAITVTDVDPGSAEHLEVAVAGAPQQIGISAGVHSVSPFTCDGERVVENGIGFAFANAVGDAPLEICWNAAQAAGVLLGLDHELLATDVMTYLTGPLPKAFVDEAASCGESTPRTCTCGGTTQNSYQQLLTTLPEAGAVASGLAAIATLYSSRSTASRRRLASAAPAATAASADALASASGTGKKVGEEQV